jgi:outer membrane protein OmpU
MKKVLLAGSALVGVAMLAAPAQAELKLDLGGHFSGYGVYVDQDNDSDVDNFEFRKNTEIHFTGETTLDNGLTVGVHVEQEVENDQNNNESYAYFSGGWGRVNFGNEDGAAYLLQVAAPSADANVDGMRSTISGVRIPALTANGDVDAAALQGVSTALADAGTGSTLDYQHADFGNGPSDSLQANPVDRLTYLTPKFNGFQAGVSYAPEATLNTGIVAMGDDTTGFENLWEIAARWDGSFEGVGLSFGAGYSHASDEATGGDDLETWNVGASAAWNQFSVGGSYLHSEEANDSKTWVVGAAWDNGPWHVGASYLNAKFDNAGISATATLDNSAQSNDLDTERFTVGGGYAFGPGMTFRGALSWGSVDGGSVTNDLGTGTARVSSDEDFTMVTIGTDIRF